MASFFKKMFGSTSSDTPAQRQLNHPRDLNVGDMVKFKLYAPPLIAGQSFKVESVNTYDYKGGSETEFTLRGAISQSFFMTVENTDEGADVRLSLKIKRNVVEQLFNLDQFAEIFDNQQGPVHIERTVNPDEASHQLSELSGWTAPKYHREVFAMRGYFHEGDYRDKNVPNDTDRCEELDYYCIVSDDETRAVEIEVFDDDEDVMLTIISDDNIIEELWPGS